VGQAESSVNCVSGRISKALSGQLGAFSGRALYPVFDGFVKVHSCKAFTAQVLSSVNTVQSKEYQALKDTGLGTARTYPLLSCAIRWWEAGRDSSQ
jgi:hypothetical protein